MEGRVFIIGLGLIGGSLALCIKKAHPEAEIIGYDVNEEQCRLAKMLSVIDSKAETVKEGAERADLILIATPVTETEHLIDILASARLKGKCDYFRHGKHKRKNCRKSGASYKKGNNIYRRTSHGRFT